MSADTAPTRTERIYELDAPLERLSRTQAARALVQAQTEAARAVGPAADALAKGAAAMAQTVRAGGVLYYVGAGSSGLMAAADAMELRSTFTLTSSQVRIAMAGGVPQTAEMPGDVEDKSGAEALFGIGARDCVVAVSASGSTPYTLSAVAAANGAGATVIAIANNDGAPLFADADHAIRLATPPEVLGGSTRLGAGTAQKIALNTLSTLMGVELGHVFMGRMVNLMADNAKLRARAARNVAHIAGVPMGEAERTLREAGGRVKVACLLAAGAPSFEAATDALAASNGHLGPALAGLGLAKM